MVDSLQLNVTQGNNQSTRKGSIQVENKNLVKCIFPNLSSDTITEAQYKKLQEIASRNGDMGILEVADLEPEEKLEQAKINGYSEYYDISLSDDKKYYVIKVKPTNPLFPDPRIEDIKKDFGLKENVFLDNNSALVSERENRSWDTERNHNFDTDKLKGGDVFKLPVAQTSFTKGPAGFWRRLF